jgi:hypothetical protein
MVWSETVQKFLRVAKNALEEKMSGDYCIRRYDEYGNAHHSINWDAINHVYACAIYTRPPRYSRRLIVVPGAIIAYTVDGLYSYCAIYQTIDVAKEVSETWEIHVNEWPPNDIDYAKAVCMR